MPGTYIDRSIHVTAECGWTLKVDNKSQHPAVGLLEFANYTQVWLVAHVGNKIPWIGKSHIDSAADHPETIAHVIAHSPIRRLLQLVYLRSQSVPFRLRVDPPMA